MNRDIKTLSGTEINALINAGWDGASPLANLTDAELWQLLDEQKKALDRILGLANPSQITTNKAGS